MRTLLDWLRRIGLGSSPGRSNSTIGRPGGVLNVGALLEDAYCAAGGVRGSAYSKLVCMRCAPM